MKPIDFVKYGLFENISARVSVVQEMITNASSALDEIQKELEDRSKQSKDNKPYLDALEHISILKSELDLIIKKSEHDWSLSFKKAFLKKMGL